MEISKADWKLYRERVSDWQEHYMEQLNQEYINLLTYLHPREMLLIISGSWKKELNKTRGIRAF